VQWPCFRTSVARNHNDCLRQKLLTKKKNTLIKFFFYLSQHSKICQSQKIIFLYIIFIFHPFCRLLVCASRGCSTNRPALQPVIGRDDDNSCRRLLEMSVSKLVKIFFAFLKVKSLYRADWSPPLFPDTHTHTHTHTSETYPLYTL
jgi:hypothetical protein